jgi:hypothetical protein
VFFTELLSFYRKQSLTPICSYEIQNLRGVTRYTSKVIGKLQNEICPNAYKKGLIVKAVCCSYDTDIFEFSEQLVINWNKVKREVKRIGIKQFCEIKVECMIEDWMLDDLMGLCSYLKIDTPRTLQGKTGFEKIQTLFRKANKVYLKGVSIQKFIKNINMEKICSKRKESLVELENLLNVTLGR